MDPGNEIRWVPWSPRQEAALREAAAALLPSCPWVAAAWLHGSAVLGGPARDVDVALLARSEPVVEQVRESMLVAGELEERLSLSPGQLDLRIVNHADPVFLGRLLGENRLIYEADRQARLLFEVRAHALWLEFRPVWERVRRAALEHWAP